MRGWHEIGLLCERTKSKSNFNQPSITLQPFFAMIWLCDQANFKPFYHQTDMQRGFSF